MKQEIPAAVRGILARLKQFGQEGYLVGGCVRDQYMGISPHDYDITTSALPQAVVGIFKDYRVIKTGLPHGTVTILAKGGPVEVTTFRQDGQYSDHRHPDAVTFTRSLREDLARRDFTMNAMAMDADGAVQDPFGGRADIDAALVRCVGEAERRFEEDALRILRGLRFAARLGFEIEPKTAAAMHAKKELLRKIAAERIFAELCGLLMGASAADILRKHRAILQVVLPEMKEPPQSFAQLPPDPPLRLAALLEKESAATVLARLKAPNAFKKTVLILLENQEIAQPETERALHRLAIALGSENLQALYAWQRWDATPLVAFLAKNPCLSIRELAIDGKELMALGLQGAAIGEAQKYLLEQVAEGLPNEKEKLIQAIKNR